MTGFLLAMGVIGSILFMFYMMWRFYQATAPSNDPSSMHYAPQAVPQTSAEAFAAAREALANEIGSRRIAAEIVAMEARLMKEKERRKDAEYAVKKLKEATARLETPRPSRMKASSITIEQKPNRPIRYGMLCGFCGSDVRGIGRHTFGPNDSIELQCQRCGMLMFSEMTFAQAAGQIAAAIETQTGLDEVAVVDPGGLKDVIDVSDEIEVGSLDVPDYGAPHDALCGCWACKRRRDGLSHEPPGGDAFRPPV